MRQKRAVGWAYGLTWSRQGIQAATTFVLAAIVGPAEFGVMALALIYIGLIDMILQQGFSAAIIQRKVLKQSHVTSVFWMMVALSLLLACAGAVLGPFWAAANRTPALASVIPVLSLALPLGALGAVPTALLTRRFRIKALTIRGVAAAAVASAVAIPMALAGLGVWSLVAMHLTYTVTSTVVVLTAARWRPTLAFRWEPARQLLRFSLGNFGAKTGDFVASQTDAIVIGIFWGPTAVGIYRLAGRLVTMAIEFLAGPLQFVSFPAFSKLQDAPAMFRYSLLSYFRLATILAWPALAIVALAGPYIPDVLGSKWAGVGYALAPLALYGAVATVTDFLNPMLKSMGRAGTMAAIVWVHGAFALGTFAAVGRLSAGAALPIQAASIGAAKAALYLLLPLPALLFFARKLLGLQPGRIVRALLPATACAAGVLLAGLAADYALDSTGWNVVIRLACLTTAAGTVWILGALALSPDLRRVVLSAAGRRSPALAGFLARLTVSWQPGETR